MGISKMGRGGWPVRRFPEEVAGYEREGFHDNGSAGNER